MPDGARDLSRLPGWPRYLSRELAAAYVGVSPTLFDQEVEQGIWPRPERRGTKGGRVTWDRCLIDLRGNRRSGILSEAEPEPGLEGIRWGKSA
jgi:hypothetical protein